MALPESAGVINFADLFGQDSTEPASLEVGTVGWDNDAEQADLGTQQNDGTTLVKVQLFRGKDPTSDITPGRGQGYRIYARLNGWPFWAIPPKGMQCVVGFPAGFATTPGAGIILALPGPNPFVQFSKTRAKVDVGPDMDLVVKAHSVTLSTYDNDYIVIGPDAGIRLADHNGNSILLKNGKMRVSICEGDPPEGKVVLEVALGALRLGHKSAGGQCMLKMAGGKATLMAGTELALVGSAVSLGGAASPATPVMVGPNPGRPSTSIFGQ